MKYGADGPGERNIALAELSGDFKDAGGNLLFSAGNKLQVLTSSMRARSQTALVATVSTPSISAA